MYVANGVLQAVPFDLKTRTIAGTPVPVLQQFAMLGGVIAVLDVAANGTLVYARGSGTSRLPVWVDRDGRETSIKAPTAMYQTPRLSPDGRRLAFFDITSSGEYDVWILDLERGTVDRLTTDRGRDSEPIWSPDSTRIAYHSGGQPGGPGIFIRRADGAGSVERLTTGTHLPVDWSADGKWIAYADFGDRGISIATVTGLMRVDIEGDHTPRVLIKGGNGRISPTERWVATTSPTTGTDEIYVLPFPDTSRGRTRISTDGGQNPTWAPDGKTLFYRRGQAMMAVAVGGDDPSTWPKPKMLFEGPYLLDVGPTHFDVARDGRLLMVKPVDADGAGCSQAARRGAELVRGVAPACAAEVKTMRTIFSVRACDGTLATSRYARSTRTFGYFGPEDRTARKRRVSASVRAPSRCMGLMTSVSCSSNRSLTNTPGSPCFSSRASSNADWPRT